MTTTSSTPATTPREELDAYRRRVRAWVADNLRKLEPGERWEPLGDDDDRASRARQLQRRLYDGGFAGICYPTEYGGQGLPIEYQRVFDAESEGYELPALFSVPTLSICGPTILEFGTEEQKQRYIPAFIRGDELWVQFMSEPTGGSDMAGALTRATRDGDVFLLNGSKVWSTYAYRSDFALCLARTNWDVPKHRGLTMFIVPVHHPGITVNQIKMVDGTEEFCEEFFDDAVIPADNVLGEVDDGWTVATRLLFHERAAVGGASPYTCGRMPRGADAGRTELIDLAKASGRAADPRVRGRVGQAEATDIVQRQLVDRVRTGLETGHFPGPAGSLVRLYAGTAQVERVTIALELAGDDALVWEGDDGGHQGIRYVQRQAACLGGGSTEMARNIISERILGMPREYAADRDVPFRDVRRNTMPSRKGSG
ncbi:MAG TPA: acyl-CoA dehydrogenase family protein [Acidimicrobiales bacterium]|nr:acyl-CoA dehydrogenase family protein [Acidimicrobiales bacterium]